MHEVLPQGPTRSGDGAVFSAAPRRARAAVSARTRVQAHRKADEPTRPIRLSSKHQVQLSTGRGILVIQAKIP